MHKSLMVLSILGVANVASAARGQENCEPSPPATCYQDDCRHCYCLGPVNTMANAPVNPRTCNGDWVVTVAGLYWEATQDGMEYAIDDHLTFPGVPPSFLEIAQLNFLVDAEYKTPNFDWDWGFKAGLGYNTTCDGWDFGIVWTWYQGQANSHIEAETDDNHVLLPIWSAYSSVAGRSLYASDIETHWKLKLNLIDLEMGKEYWTSKYLSFRPFIGLRIAYINQDFEIKHKGGSWSDNFSAAPQGPFNNVVDLDNDFHGVGIRSGFNTVWNLGCGWAIYGDLAASILYGRFTVDHDETNRKAVAAHDKTVILETKESFRASRAIVDLGLGIQWSTMFCDCQYGFTVALGWEQHLFFHQNQMWRVNRIWDISTDDGPLPNNSGDNAFFQRRGTLDTHGVTLKLQFEF